MPKITPHIKISIVIPTFNRADLIGQTLQSVALQTSKPYEVMVVDNCSTDNTAQIVKRYLKFGIKYIVNPKNLGMVGNYNRCLELAKGDYVSFLHSDDLISPDWHETWVKIIRSHKADFYTSSLCVIDEANKPSYVFHTYPDSQSITREELQKSLLNHYCPLLAPIGSTIFSKSTLLKAGKFIDSLTTEADADISLKVISSSSLYYVKKVLFAHRRHASQTFDLIKVAKTEDASLKRLRNYFQIVRKYSESELINANIKRLFITTHVFMSLCSINLYLARFEFSKVFSSNKVAREVFPDLFYKPLDWSVFLKIQTIFIVRALMNRFQYQEDRHKLSWLKTINLSSPTSK